MNAGLTLDTLVRRAENFFNLIWDRIVWKLTLGEHWVVEVVAIVSDTAPELLCFYF